jgi:hypothetical protein
LGFLLTPGHLVVANETAGRNCLVSPFLLIHPFEVFWTIGALALLTFAQYERRFFWYRLGLACGVATWLAPLVNLSLFRSFLGF